MSDFMNMDSIGALSNLMQESAEAQQQQEEQVAPMTLNNTTVVTASGMNKKMSESEMSKLIWLDSEIPTEDMLLARAGQSNKLPTPKYEFRYKQSVGTEDTYLGMSDKSPGSFDCTHLVVKVHFPNARMKDLDLDVTKNRIKVESRSLRLFTYLPVNVHHEQGSAKFDSKKEVLTVTLPIDDDMQ
mmetsp:Transcript_5642/g.9229  ORF Transcript_5642/g.9229 Transcript_5642/m.9229 type:complete len:185 (-) Transcript_5642:179-733(-)